MAYSAPLRRQPWDERLPDGRTVTEALARLTGDWSYPQNPVRGDLPSIPVPPRTDEFAPFTGSIPTGSFAGDAPPPRSPAIPQPNRVITPQIADVRPTGPAVAPLPEPGPPSSDPLFAQTRMGKLLEQRRRIQDRPENTSRGSNLLKGLLQGAAIAAQGPTEGAAWRALGGAGTGAAAGGISPRLMDAYLRKQEMDRNTEEITQQQGVEFGNARLKETLAQAEQRRAEPALRQAAIDRQIANDELLAADREDRLEETRRMNSARIAQFEEATKNRQAQLKLARERLEQRAKQHQETLAERIRANKARESKPTRDIAGEKESDRLRAALEASKQAEALYSKGHDYWEQAKQKRAEADRLSASPTSRIQNKERIRALTDEAESLEKQTREVQKEGDMKAAESQAKGTANPSGGGGKLDEQTIRNAAIERGLDPEEAVRRARARRQL